MPWASHIHSSQAQCEGDLWAFERIPRRIFQWSWVSCGLVSKEHMSKLSGLDNEFLTKEIESAPYDWKSIVELPEAPRPTPTVTPPSDVKLTGELVHFWQVRATTDPMDDNWNTIPSYMWHAIDRELNCYNFTKTAKRKRIVAKDWHVFCNTFVCIQNPHTTLIHNMIWCVVKALSGNT